MRYSIYSPISEFDGSIASASLQNCGSAEFVDTVGLIYEYKLV